jgi:hypothetical protein
MPRLTVWALRLALVWWGVGLLLGALILAREALGWPALAAAIPAHAEMVLVGWMIQFALGVAYWILPRVGVNVDHPPAHVVAAFVLLNAGVILVVSGVLAAGRGAEALGVAGFVVHALRRVRGVDLSAALRH